MKSLKDYTQITVETEDGELIASITADNIISKDGYQVRLTPDYEAKR